MTGQSDCLAFAAGVCQTFDLRAQYFQLGDLVIGLVLAGVLMSSAYQIIRQAQEAHQAAEPGT